MSRTTILFIFLVLLTAGCRPTSTAQPTLSATIDVPVGTAVSVRGTAFSTAAVPLSGNSQVTFPVLETLAAANASRISLLAQVGEGTFEDQIRISPDGDLLAVATSGGILLADSASGQRLGFYSAPTQIDSLAFSPNGKYLAAVHREPGEELMTTGETAGMQIYQPILTVRDLASGEPLFSLNLAGQGCGQYAAWDLTYSPDGQNLVFRDQYSWLGHDRADNLCVLSSMDGSLIRTIPVDLPWQSASPVLFTSNGQQLLVAVVDRSTEGFSAPSTRVRAYEASTGNLVREMDGRGTIHDMALSPDEKWLALATQQGARLFSAEDGSLLVEFGNHTRGVTSVEFSPGGATLALGSLDGTVSMWAVPECRSLWQSQAWLPVSPISSEEFVPEIWDLAFSPDGAVLFTLAPTHSVATSGRMSALKVTNGQELFSFYGRNNDSQPALSPDGSRLAFGGYEDGRAQVWSVAENKLLFELEGHTGMVLAAAFSPEGEQLVTTSLDGTVRLWNMQDGSPVVTLSGHTGSVRKVQYSPDGSRLVSVGDDATLRLWDAIDGHMVKSIDIQTSNWVANTIAFSPDGKSALVATGCPYSHCPAQGAGDLRRVDLESGQIATLIAQPVYSVTFSADQDAFAMWSPQGIQSGRLSQGQFQAQITYTSPMGTGALIGTAVTPDGQLFLSGNGYGLHVWNTASGEMLTLRKGSGLPCGDMWVTPDQKLILIAQLNGLVSLWGVPAGQ